MYLTWDKKNRILNVTEKPTDRDIVIIEGNRGHIIDAVLRIRWSSTKVLDKIMEE